MPQPLGPGSAAHHAAKGSALRCARGTDTFVAALAMTAEAL